MKLSYPSCAKANRICLLPFKIDLGRPGDWERDTSLRSVQTHLVADETFAISPVYAADEDLTNIGMISAIFKEALDFLAASPRAEISYMVGEGSTLVDRVLLKNSFQKSDDVWSRGPAGIICITRSRVTCSRVWAWTKFPYRTLAHLDAASLDNNALFHGTLYLGSRAEWAADRLISEILQNVRGGSAGKPGGVPGGTGQWSFDPADLVEVQVGNILGPEESQALLNYLVENENNFTTATIVPPGARSASVNEELRKSRTLDKLGKFEGLLTEKIKQHLQPTLQNLGLKQFPLGRIEIQATASGDGDYFRLHPDSDANDTRELSFVYFVHDEPRRFSGGELRIFATKVVNGEQSRADHSHMLSPRRDAMVFFPSLNQHEVLPVRVPTKEFRHSRFTVNGWIHRAK